MVRLEARSKKPPEEVIERAIVHFSGQRGWGMDVMRRDADYVLFTAAGGSVSVNVAQEGQQTVVEVVSREWDKAARDFLKKL
jgi:hypothetical protein